MRYVIAYDISDDTRRNKVAKFLEGWGRRVQKSVFECDLSLEELQVVQKRLEELMVLAEDRCHIYRLCGECQPKRIVLGQEIEPEWAQTLIL